MTADPARQRMSSDEFLAWAMEQPDGRRYELVGGEVVAMPPERLAHTETKALVWLALRTAIERAGLDCQALADGVSVEVEEGTIYEPDALVRCGERLPG
ncbi:MAG TPA: Uma2 family endonuclease, partial [Geminicoccaceae bacterium]|nr:Uma2 family endonuclease [Geminicoccaceae bacterium]